MGKKIKQQATTKGEKKFLDRFQTLCYSRSSWEVWADFITATACAIANSVDKDSEYHNKREKEYEECINRLGGIQIPAELLGITTMELEANPEQDFLGSLFMKLELGSHWKGQFFTPYCVCKTMAAITALNLEDTIKDKGWVSVNDCACGAGATLIATANTLREHNVNYQNSALFVAQDIDRIAGLMCYIQLSLLGCPGYVVIADSISNPTVGSVLRPTQKDGQEFWFTPMYTSDIWHYRRLFNMMDSILFQTANS